MVASPTKSTSDIHNKEHEETPDAKRVVMVDASGNVIDASNPIPVDTELTIDGNLIIDNVSVFATDISDSTTTSFALVDASGHQQVDVLTIPNVVVSTLPDVDINDISKGTQTNDVKITMDGEEVTTIPGPIQGRTFVYEDTSFVTGESPRVLDVNTDLGRNSVDGYIINDGTGNILVEFSDNGTNYGGQHTLQKGEVIDLKNLNIDSIRLIWVSNSSYRILVV